MDGLPAVYQKVYEVIKAADAAGYFPKDNYGKRMRFEVSFMYAGPEGAATINELSVMPYPPGPPLKPSAPPIEPDPDLMMYGDTWGRTWSREEEEKRRALPWWKRWLW